MKASANRTQDNESRAVANNVSCKREEREAVRFVDNSSHTKSIAQLQAIADRSVNPHDVQMRKLLAIINNSPQRKTPVLPGVTQRKGPLDEEELQFKSKEAVQKKGPLDEEELQFKKDETVQCKGPLDEEELQFKAEEPVQKQENKTGLPDDLKAGVENISGLAMDDVRVHYNSGKPAQLNAYAYTQGTEIHVAPGQEKHLPHEAWHVVQQKQGRVKPTVQMAGGVAVNDDKGLENEADLIGTKTRNRLQRSDCIAKGIYRQPLQFTKYVYNKVGTSRRKCRCQIPSKTWLAHWSRLKNIAVPAKCQAYRCRNQAQVGAHVQVEDKDGRVYYIVPFCKKHNKRPKNVRIRLKETARLSKAGASCY